MEDEEDPAADTYQIAAWTSQAPANFKVTYVVSTHTATCTWNAVTNPVPHDYRVYKWDQNDYGTVYYCYQQLVTYEPTAGPYFTDLSQRVDTMINTPGLTYAERQAMLDAIEIDLDALNNIMCSSSNTNVANLLRQMKSAASSMSRSVTNWSDTNCNDDTFYWYAVVTRNSSHVDTSPLSHTEALFAVRTDYTNPAAPTGVTAKAYDPGVFVEWARNTESDLAGYNVYLQSGGSWVKLNTTLITTGTEYYYASGAAGQVFAVRAVDMSNRESNRSASATAVLQPATVYLATDPGWTTTGTWKVEYYTLLPPPDTGPADLLVAQDTDVHGQPRLHRAAGEALRLHLLVLRLGATSSSTARSGRRSAWAAERLLLGHERLHHFRPLQGQPHLRHQVPGDGGGYGFNFVNVQYIEAR